MRHRNLKYRLGRTTAHRKALMSNMSMALFKYERIVTTLAKAKALRSEAEKLITLGKRGDLHARRQVLKVVSDKKIIKKLFTDLASRFADRNGGYTRVLKLANRRGDGAETAIIELVDYAERQQEAAIAQEKSKTGKTEKPKAAKTVKPKMGKQKKPKTDKTEKPKATKAEKPKTVNKEKAKTDKSEKPKAKKEKKPKTDTQE